MNLYTDSPPIRLSTTFFHGCTTATMRLWRRLFAPTAHRRTFPMFISQR